MTTDPTKPDYSAQLDHLRAVQDTTAPIEEEVWADDYHTAQLTDTWQRRCPPMFWDATLETLDAEVREVVDGWLSHRSGNLVFFGPVGSGKSHAAAAVGRALHFAGHSTEFWPHIELLEAAKPGKDPHHWSHVCQVPYLIVDDIGTEAETEWAKTQTYRLANSRELYMRPVISTANLEPGPGGALEVLLGERTYSRLVRGAVAVRITGDDRRRDRRLVAPKPVAPQPVEPKREPDFGVALAGVAQAREALKRAGR